MSYNQDVVGARFLSGARESDVFPCLFQLLKAACIPSLKAPPSVFKIKPCSIFQSLPLCPCFHSHLVNENADSTACSKESQIPETEAGTEGKRYSGAAT